MARPDSFKGYGPETGYTFLTELIAAHDYGALGVKVAPDEIFVSDGAKCDTTNIQEIFGADCTVALTDPVYPAYVDSNVMAGRAGRADATGRYDRLVYLPATAENAFTPALPTRPVDLIYLCYPNNPTGAVLSREALAEWVDYARRHQAVILYDAAYEAYIRDPDVPHSIFEIDGAREVAIEFRSFSKTAGFTGTRCAFTVVPKELMGQSATGEAVSLHALWFRRQSTKFNGVPYIIQKASAAVYTPDGQRQVREAVDFYMENAAHHPRRARRRRPHRLRRAQCALHLGEDAAGPRLLAALRQAPERGARGEHAGGRLRAERRGLSPPHRLRAAGSDGRGRRADPDPRQALAVTTPAVGLSAVQPGLPRRGFVPAKNGGKPDVSRGRWLLVQDQRLIVRRRRRRRPAADRRARRRASGRRSTRRSGSARSRATRAGSRPCRATTRCPRAIAPRPWCPCKGTRLPDELLSLGGMAMQALWWEATSGHCPRCGERTERLAGEWGKRCPRCRYEHYPHLHPAVIVLVTDGDRCLLARKAGWAPGRYALVAGFVDNGESFEGTVAREVKEEVGVDVTDIRYVGSQNWPFPSQIMVGFVATYAGGEIKVDPDELEDARWFPRGELPGLPSRHSISRFIIDHYGR